MADHLLLGHMTSQMIHLHASQGHMTLVVRHLVRWTGHFGTVSPMEIFNEYDSFITHSD